MFVPVPHAGRRDAMQGLRCPHSQPVKEQLSPVHQLNDQISFTPVQIFILVAKRPMTLENDIELI